MVTNFSLDNLNNTFEVNLNTSSLPFNKLNFSYSDSTGVHYEPSLVGFNVKILDSSGEEIEHFPLHINKSSMFLNDIIDQEFLNSDGTFNFDNGNKTLIFLKP